MTGKVPPGFIPVAEAAKALGTGTENLRRILRTGKLSDDVIGGNHHPWYVRISALDRLMSNKRETFIDLVGDDALRLSIMEIVEMYGCSIHTAGKIRRAACMAAGLPTPGERREMMRRKREAVQKTSKGYQQVKVTQ